MTFTTEQLNSARKEGYSDDEIWEYLGGQDKGFAGAKQEGYSLDEVAGYFSSLPAPTTTDKLQATAEELEAGIGRAGGAFAQAAVGSVRMLTDVFGANNPVSKKIAGVEDYLDQFVTAQARQDQKEISRLFQEAEDKGLGAKVMAGLEAVAVSPETLGPQIAGYMLPSLAAGVLTAGASLPVTIGTQATIGGLQAAGTIKGEIYKSVRDFSREQGLTEEQADKAASEAQAYGGKNLDQILIGAGIGALAASTGVERIATRILSGQGKEVTKKSIGEFIKTGLKAGAVEGVVEGVQEGQEQMAQNIALQREGADVPTMRMVPQAATMGAAAGALMGGAAGGIEYVSAEQKELNDIEKTAERESRSLSAPDAATQSAVNTLNQAENSVDSLREELDTLEPTDPRAQNLRMRISEEQKKAEALKVAIGEKKEETVQQVESRIEKAKVELVGLEPTSRKAKILEAQIAQDEAKVTALSEPITKAEEEQARLAREIAAPVEEAAPAEPTSVAEAPAPTVQEGLTVPPTEEAVTPPVEPAQAVEQLEVSIPVSGQPFEFFSIRNTEQAPQLGTQFGQDIEPSGKYISQSTPDAARNLDERFEKGVIRFENPLVVEFGGEYGTPTNWKNVLSSQYEGKTGTELSQAVRDAGYDGIVTVEPSTGPNRPAQTSEIVDIRSIKPSVTAAVEPTPVTTLPVTEAVTPTPTAPAVGNRIKLGRSPQPHTIEEVIPQTETDKKFGEQYYNVKNERTGKVQTVEAKDLKPIKKMPIRKAISDPIPTPPEKRVKFSDIIDTVQDMFGKDFVAGRLYVMDDVNEKAKAGYDPEDGRIYLNEAYMDTDDSIRELIAHELGHYIAGDPTMRPKFQEFLASLPKNERARLERFVDRVYNDQTGEIRLEEKEVRAFIMRLNAGDNRNKFQKLLDDIKQWLNERFGTKFKLTDRDAAAILSGAIARFKGGEFIERKEDGTRRVDAMSEMDADYLDAVERGDMETAQRMVDEAAKAAGYDIRGYHGTRSPIGFTEFIPNEALGGAIFVATEPSEASAFGRVMDVFIRAKNVRKGVVRSYDEVRAIASSKKRGQDAIRVTDGVGAPINYAVFDPTQIKSADPVTYDDAGNVIPLSQRFQPAKKDIRYARVERSEDVEKDIVIAEKIQSVVNDTISKMPQDQGRDYNAFVNEGKSEAQIAEETGKEIKDVRTNIVRGKKEVGDAIKKAKIDTKAKPENVVLEWTTGAAKKYLTKEGDLPGGTFQKWVKRNAKLAREAEEARQATQDFYEGLRKIHKINKLRFIWEGLSSINPDDVASYNDALAGETPISDMPVEIQEPLTRMRQHIDAMSAELIATGQLPDYLEAKAMNNLGIYLTRSYKIFSDPKWINKIPQEKLTAARNFLYHEEIKRIKAAKEKKKDDSPITYTIEDADRKLEQMLNDWAGERGMEGKRGGRLGAKDLSVMMTRSEVPKQLRDVMGENTNVIFNYANTIAKISRFVADQRFLESVKQEGAGKFLFTKDAAPKGFNTLIAPEESRTMAPLSGLRTTPEIAKAFEEFGKAYDAKSNPFLYTLGWLNAVGKANLTVGSLFTQARNMIGQPFFFLANGHSDISVITKEVNKIMKDKGMTKEQARNELIKMAAGEALVNENAYAGELREAFDQIGLKTFEDMDADEFSRMNKLIRLFKKGTQGAQRVYQKTDELGKLIGWLNETKRVQSMNPSMSRQEAMSVAAERTRNTYPTYSNSSEAMRLFRRQPFFGPFATFFYETFRTTYWNVRYAYEDINSGTEAGKKAGIARLSGTMAQISIGAFAVNAISAMMAGIGDQEEEDVRRMLPPWAQNASLVWLPKTKDGVYDFINFSSLNPYNALSDPFVTMMSGFSRGEDPTEIFINSAGTFLSPFTSEQPVTAATVDALRNVTERGTKVYNEEDDLTTKTSKILLHIFGKAFTPGTIDRLRKRIIPAVKGETVSSRAPEPYKEIAAEFTGVRFENLDMRQAFQNKAWEFNKAQNDSERIFRDVATRRRIVTEEEQIDAYRRAEQSRYQNWQDMYRNYMALRRAGASKSEAMRLMTDIKISQREASYIARGKYVPYEVSDEVRRRSKLNGNTVPLKEIKQIAKEMPRVLEDIK